jgi:hypothetical protein
MMVAKHAAVTIDGQIQLNWRPSRRCIWAVTPVEVIRHPASCSQTP